MVEGVAGAGRERRSIIRATPQCVVVIRGAGRPVRRGDKEERQCRYIGMERNQAKKAMEL